MDGSLSLLLALGLVLILTVALLRWQKSKGGSPGSKRKPMHGSPLLKNLSQRLFEEIGLPSQEFRQEMGVIYPDLSMAFRQSLNFGVVRYTDKFWQQGPDEALIPDIINRLLCNYYGFILPRNFTPQDVQSALAIYYKQKKILRKAELQGQTLQITEKGAVLAAVELQLANDTANLESLKQLINAVSEKSSEPGIALHLFREIPAPQSEYGFVMLDAEHLKPLQAYAKLAQPAL